jgi:hypothetical protein
MGYTGQLPDPDQVLGLPSYLLDYCSAFIGLVSTGMSPHCHKKSMGFAVFWIGRFWPLIWDS